MLCKKMIYQKDRKRELLCSDEYNGFKFYVMSLGTHPTAYVEIPKKHKYYNINYQDIDDVYVHGGLTYSDNFLIIGDEQINGWFIGWDYAHYNDYIGYEMMFPEFMNTKQKKWTTEEIIEDCKNVIEQIKGEKNERTKTC